MLWPNKRVRPKIQMELERDCRVGQRSDPGGLFHSAMEVGLSL